MDEIGRDFTDAFNRRDADGLVALADPAIEFCPTELVGSRRAYHGHEGLRQWVADLGNRRSSIRCACTKCGHSTRAVSCCSPRWC